MWYAIISEDNENSLPLRASARGKHIERLRMLADQGRLLIAGPHPAIDAEDVGEAGFTGSLIVAEFESLAAARAWAKALSASSLTTAFSTVLTASIRCRQASTSSSELTSPAATAPAICLVVDQ